MSDPGWPKDTKLQERSLATLLSRLDREQDLTWLGDRPDVQAILARLLQCSVSDLLKPSRTEADGARLLRWNDLPFARVLDLRSEALPPTVPPEVTDPARWERTFWVAPSGAGRSLVGQWLAARGLAHFRGVQSLGELDPVGDDAPLFVEIRSVRDAVGAAPAQRRLCVAGELAPPPNSGWRVVHTPSVEHCLPALVHWLCARFPNDSALDETALLEWLTSGPVSSGEADSFGAVVGLAGVLDRVGTARARGKSVLDLARLDTRRRFDEAFGAEARDVAWQRRNSVDVLVAMARRALTDDTLPFASPRTLEEWTALVPDEHKSGLDVEWLRVSLARVDASIRPSDVERAARRLSPGAFRIVRALSQAGLLVPAGDDRLSPAPRWISRAVELEAERQLLGASPFEWGEALLSPHAAPRIADRLLDGLVSGESAVLADVVELEASESPAYAVAVETTFRCAGLALLAGAELDHEQLADLWDATRELSISLAGAQLPRIDHPAGLGAILHRGSHHLAGLALGELLERTWPRDAEVYDAIQALLDDDGGAAFTNGVHALVDRLRRTSGGVGHALETPGLVLDSALSEELDWATVRTSPAEVTTHLWRARGHTALEPLSRALFAAWERAGCPEVAGSVLDPSSEAGRALFAVALAPLALRMLERAGAARKHLVPVAGEQVWRLLSDTPPVDRDLCEALAEALPEAWVERWLSRRSLQGHVWRRHADAALARLEQLARDGDVENAILLAGAAPSHAQSSVLDALAAREELGRLAAPAREPLRRWLHGLVAARRRGWREAYSFLARLEA